MSQLKLFRPIVGSGPDLLGDEYCDEHDAHGRRAHGITLTPAWLVDAMMGLVKADHYDTIIDCGAGTGRFAIAAALHFPQARIVAVESHPDMVTLLRQRLWETGLGQRVELVEADFRDANLPRQGRCLFVGNPPYVRHHDIDPTWKAWYAHGMVQSGMAASQLAGLHAHFMLRAAQLMRPGDGLCFVTAAEWLDNRYGAALRQLCMGGERAVRSLWVCDANELVFPDALVSAVVVHVEAAAAPGLIQVGRMADRQLVPVRGITPAQLVASERWSALVRAPSLDMAAGGLELGELFRVTRGQVTGLNEAWVLSADDAQRIPGELLVPAVTRALEIINGDVVKAGARARLKQVVDLPADLDALPAQQAKAARGLMERARQMGAHQTYIARHRKPWYAVAMREPPAAFVSYMGRRPPVFQPNPHRVSFLNIAHGLYPRGALDGPVLARLIQHLNEHTQMHEGRIYGGGLAKFEPSDIARLKVPAHVLEPLA